MAEETDLNVIWKYLFEKCGFDKLDDDDLRVYGEAFALPSFGVGWLKEEFGDWVFGVLWWAVVDSEINSSLFLFLHV